MREPAKALDRHVSFRGPPFFRPPGEEGAACSNGWAGAAAVRERRSTGTKSNGHSVVPGNCRQESLNEGGRGGGEYMYGADKPQMKKMGRKTSEARIGGGGSEGESKIKSSLSFAKTRGLVNWKLIYRAGVVRATRELWDEHSRVEL
jgi:hypothetical protein